MRMVFAATLFTAMIGSAQDNTVRLRVDATDAPRRLYHIHMTMPVKAGPMTLLYPQWIPGEHGPTGPITDLVGLKIQSGEPTDSVERDSVNMYAFHVTVPDGREHAWTSCSISSPPPETAGFSSGGSATTELAVLNWNQFLLYPQGTPSGAVAVIRRTCEVPNSLALRHGAADRARIR